MGTVARAYLAQTLAAIDAGDSRVGGLLAELTNQAVVSATGSHWAEPNAAIKPWIMGTDVRTTAGVLDALVRLRPNHPLVTSAVRWLMAARRYNGSWESTHDSSMSLLALTDFLASSGEFAASFTWQVGVNGTPKQHGSVGDGASSAASGELVVPMPELNVGENRVDLLRTIGAGRLYYTLQLETFGQAEDMPFISHGFSVAREYLAPNAAPDAAPLSQVHAGDLVQVRLTVVAPSDLHDVVIEDPLPAGLEPIDTRLKTVSQAAADAVRASQSPGWQPWSHLDVRSDRIVLFATYLTKGAHQYIYLARASLPGDYRVLPANGHEQYFPEVNARSDGRRFTVLP
jgi:uncharacterized protein YfaS (alpha-2-macroglobulin family)